MQNNYKNIVEKEIFEYKATSRDIAVQLQYSLDNILQNKIPNKIDEISSRYLTDNEIVRIDKMEIDLGEININNFEYDFIDKFSSQFEEQLLFFAHSAVKIKPEDRHAIKYTTGDVDFELISFFLRTGVLPWWFADKELINIDDIFINVLNTSEKKIFDFLASETDNAESIARIFNQFHPDTTEIIFKKLLEKITSTDAKYINELLEIISTVKNISQAANIFKVIKLRSLLMIAHAHKAFDKHSELLISMAGYTASATHESNEKIILLFYEPIFEALNSGKTANQLLLGDLYNILSEKKISANIIENVKSIFINRYILPKQTPIGKAATALLLFFQTTDELLINNITENDFLLFINKYFFEPDFFDTKNISEEVTAIKKRTAKSGVKKEATGLPDEKATAKKSIDEKLKFDSDKNAADSKKILLKKEIEQTDDSRESKKILSKEKIVPREEKTADETEIEELIVSNAGIVIIGTFIPHLFKNLNYLENGLFKNIKLQQRAVHLLQYLVCKETNTPEYKLPLNKILCGVPLEVSIEKNIEITDEEKTQCEELIKAALHNWKEMRGTSVEGFKNTFFYRQGILKKINTDWQLRVDRKALDILIGTLPWSISLIKFSWMKNIVYVEW